MPTFPHLARPSMLRMAAEIPRGEARSSEMATGGGLPFEDRTRPGRIAIYGAEKRITDFEGVREMSGRKSISIFSPLMGCERSSLDYR